MKPTTFLRIASIITLLYFAGHTSGMPWTPDVVGSATSPVVEAMKGHSFDVAGSMRTYWDIYFGFGSSISLFMLISAVVLWQLSSLARTEARAVRPIIAVFLIGFIANTVLAWKYFFVVPLVMSAAIAISLAFAFVAAGRSKQV
jgi:hypothetical protein